MFLRELIDNERTDKNTSHSYLPIYQSLFEKRAESARRVMEIGIYKGASIKLWNDYFTRAIIHGIDIESDDYTLAFLRDLPRVHLHVGRSAYQADFVRDTFEKTELKFDVIVEDGSHELEHMIFFVKHYLKLLSPRGICIIEDVPDIDWIKILYENTPEEYREYCYFCDLRSEKNRYDDIMFIVDLSCGVDVEVNCSKKYNLQNMGEFLVENTNIL